MSEVHRRKRRPQPPPVDARRGSTPAPRRAVRLDPEYRLLPGWVTEGALAEGALAKGGQAETFRGHRTGDPEQHQAALHELEELCKRR